VYSCHLYNQIIPVYTIDIEFTIYIKLFYKLREYDIANPCNACSQDFVLNTTNTRMIKLLIIPSNDNLISK